MPPHKAENPSSCVEQKTGGKPKPGSESARVKFLDEHFEGDKEGARGKEGVVEDRRPAGAMPTGWGYDSRLARQASEPASHRGTRRLSSPPLPSSLASLAPCPPPLLVSPLPPRAHPLPR